MPAYEAPRGVAKDLRFFLKQVVGGPLQDAYNFTDGLAHGQWPTVRFYTGPNGTGTEITSTVVKDITSDTITTASHKDPTGTTGVWRQSQGTYWIRVLPQNSVSFGDYYMRVSFQPTSGNTWTEDFDFEVLIPGDVDPNADITVDDVIRSFSTSITDTTIIEGIITDATEEIFGRMEAGGFSNPEAYFLTIGGMPRSIRRAIIMKAQCLLGNYDLSAGRRFKSIQEGSEKITYAGNDVSLSICDQADATIAAWLKQNAPGRQPMFGTITKLVGHTINDDGLTNDTTFIQP